MSSSSYQQFLPRVFIAIVYFYEKQERCPAVIRKQNTLRERIFLFDYDNCDVQMKIHTGNIPLSTFLDHILRGLINWSLNENSFHWSHVIKRISKFSIILLYRRMYITLILIVTFCKFFSSFLLIFQPLALPRISRILCSKIAVFPQF